MIDLVEQNRSKLLSLCKKYDVRQLGLFGSATRDDFDSVQSDLDFVVEFNNFTVRDAFDRFFGLKIDLEDLFGREIDLVSYRAIRNPFFKQVIDNTRVTVYAA